MMSTNVRLSCSLTLWGNSVLMSSQVYNCSIIT